MAVALVSGIGGPATVFSARAASYAVLPVAAIEQSPNTIGIAEGHDFYLMSDADINKTLDAMQGLGVQNVRIGIFWADIESEQGVFKWDNVDRMVEAATARGMGILATVLYTPRWAGATQSPADTEWASHPDPVKFGNFVRAVAEEYAGRISTYEIWNEPTTTQFWDPADPGAYTQLLKEGYQAIKGVDPSALVIAGSVVAGPTRVDGSTMSPVDFLKGMYDAGAKGYFDALSYHPYQHTTSFSGGQDQPYFDYPIEQLDEIRALMIDKGDGNLKVWITEYGQPTTTLNGNVVLTEAQQAAFIEDLVRTWQNIDGAGPVFIYQTRDTQAGSIDVEHNYGLFDNDWERKLAADVLADLIDELRPVAVPVNPLAAFLQQIVRAIGQTLAFIPNLITQVVRAVAHFVGSITGINSTRASASEVGAMSDRQHGTAEDISPVNAARMTVADNALRTGTAGDAAAVPHVEPLRAPEPLQQAEQLVVESDPPEQAEDAMLREVPILDRRQRLAKWNRAEDAGEHDLDVVRVRAERENSSTDEDRDTEDESVNSDVDKEPPANQRINRNDDVKGAAPDTTD